MYCKISFHHLILIMEVFFFGKKLRCENIFFDSLQLRFQQEFILPKKQLQF